MFKRNFKWIIPLSIGGIGILLPLVFFIYHFGQSPISKDLNDWSSFGGYIGGVVNTFISLLSLIILAYITYEISKFSNEENRNLFLLQKRIDAYNEFSKNLPNLYLMPRRMSRFMHDFSNGNKFEEEQLLATKKAIDEVLRSYEEHYYFLANFKARYSHLFNFNFESAIFLALEKSGKDLIDDLELRYTSFPSSESDKKNHSSNSFSLHIKNLNTFIKQIRTELE